jgi:hypothetical protein
LPSGMSCRASEPPLAAREIVGEHLVV